MPSLRGGQDAGQDVEKPDREEGAEGEGEDTKEQDDASTAAKDADKTNTTESSAELKTQRLKQLLFDLLYIHRFVEPNGGEDVVSSLCAKADVADLDDAAVGRLKKNAADYAKKTYLLFALLA